ncbi:MAG TPA: cell division protein ZipA C-terminal FtsZ-binding domain-containing protein [Casimicrobiaceae bacterium]|nr:cell division protein ZipA C-terminal FtsZ-binding domain-containing protein [Casimicrobiaceae bacterium]
MAGMNPLFVGLIAAGVLLVAGVLIYNWLQERRVRRRMDTALRKSDGTPPGVTRGRGRIEPMLNADNSESSQSVAIEMAPEDDQSLLPQVADEIPDESLSQVVPATKAERLGLAPDPDIECVALLQPAQAASTAALGSARSADGAKPVRWLGRRGVGTPWQLIDGTTQGPWHEVAGCLLLANRAGPVSRAELDSFQRLVSELAVALGAPNARIDPAAEADRAEALDRFCADLDVQIGLTILKSELGQIAGTRLRGVAEAAGFRINSAGHFEHAQEETGAAMYTLQNYKQEPFSVESLRRMTTPGVVFVLDVPRVSDPVRVFDQMRMTAKRMTQTLEGVLVDDNRRPITDTSLAAIRAQVQVTAAALRDAHIDPGGPRALRLFG